MTIKVDRDVPIPILRSEGITASLRALLRAGDSVLVEASKGSIAQAARAAGLVGKYTARKENGGVRVWRTKE